jgi:hypothetical protein
MKKKRLLQVRAILPRRGQTKAQVGVEYMIIIGFVTLAIMSVVVMAYFYSGQIKDKIRLNQVENFASQLIGSAESVFFAGEPSKTTIRLYLPEGVENITIMTDLVIITTTTSSGKNKRGFETQVPLSGTITPNTGIKKLLLEARDTDVLISQV